MNTRPVALVALTLIVALPGCQSALGSLADARGYRYCEVLLQYDDTAEVWGTQSLNRCPAEKWDTTGRATS